MDLDRLTTELSTLGRRGQMTLLHSLGVVDDIDMLGELNQQSGFVQMLLAGALRGSLYAPSKWYDLSTLLDPNPLLTHTKGMKRARNKTLSRLSGNWQWTAVRRTSRPRDDSTRTDCGAVAHRKTGFRHHGGQNRPATA